MTDAEVAAELRAAIPRVVRTGSSPLWHSLLMSARAEWAYLDSLPAERFGIGWTRWDRIAALTRAAQRLEAKP